MTHTVWTTETTATVREAAELMAQHEVGFLPVIHEHVSAGVITDRDLVVRVIAEHLDPDTTYVGSIVSALSRTMDDPRQDPNAAVASLPEDTPIEEAVRYMDEKQVRRVTVHDKEYRIVGVLSRADLPQATATSHG
jgi:CBS domain-containing protein